MTFLENNLFPHAFCYAFNPWLIALNSISDAVIALAYFAIPLMLSVILKSAFSRHANLVRWFMAFIVLCGVTHVLEVVSIWTPIYYFAGAVKAVTALVSVGAAFELGATVRRVMDVYQKRLQDADRDAIRRVFAAFREECRHHG